jgi:PAS domain S-box-containing protein
MNAPKAQLLLVEDEAIIALNIAGILESKGYEVVASLATGKEAVDFVQSRKPDCVLMDIMLRGGMDGIEAAGKIRSMASVPVIYLTAHTDDATLERAKATEPYGYVVKPINQGELISAIEITLYKHNAEKRIRESEEKLRNIVEHSTNAFYSHTPDHVLTYVSPQFYDILGYTVEEVPGRWTDLATDNPVNTHGFNLTMKALETGERQPPYELELLHRDGHRVFVEVHEAPVVAEGKAVAIVGSLTDITERKNAESALKLSEERYRNLVETMRDGMVVIDAENRISYVNPMICEIFGYTKEQLVGTSPLDYLDGENAAIFIEQVRNRRAGKSEVYELEWSRSDGRRVLTQVSPRAIYDESGNYAGSFGVIADITERRRAEELMLQNEKMMTIGGLAAGMAHEINNPLGIILQGVQATQLKISGDYEINRRLAEETGIDLSRMKEYLARSEVLTYLDGISEAGMRAAEIVTSMLQFSRRSSGIKTKTDINDLIDRTIEMASRDYDLRRKFDFKKIVITRNYDRSIPEVGCIPTEIEQVMLNLLKNAAQAMSEKDAGEYVPLISIATAAEGGEAVIRISDNGPGIDEYTRKHLFEPFYTTKAPGEGTGLGLAVSFFIISKNHGGTITADSGEGAGTTFTVKLPLED